MKVLMLTADGVEDSEFFYPYYRLLEAGHEVDVAGPEANATVTGKHGYPFKVNLGFDQIKDDYDALVLPGGKAPETVRLNEKAVQVTRSMFQKGKVVAAICHGAQTLVSAGVLDGRKATCWPGVRDDLKAAGAQWKDAEVVVDGNLITSRGPDDLPAFGRELVKAVH